MVGAMKRAPARLARCLLAGALLGAAGCATERAAALDGDETDGGGGDPPRVGVAPLRRLTRDEFVRTLTDLFGDALPPELPLTAALPVDDHDGGFATNTTAVTDTIVEQYQQLAEVVAEAVTAHRGALHPCLTPAVPAPQCARSFVEAFGPRAMRRPLTPEELDGLTALMWSEPPATAAAADLGTRRVIATLLQSPDFLYRIERGRPDADDTDTVRLAGHEVATRMSYLVWGSMPDAALMADAAAGRLDDPGYRATVLDRLLDDPRATAGLGAMHRQWLGMAPLDHLVKDRNLYPTFTEALGPELADELTEFVDLALRHGDATLHTLLTSNRTIATTAVTSWYGADAVSIAPAPDRFGAGRSLVTLDPTRRAGVLTLLSVMAAHAKPDRSDPIDRGVLVRQALLCQPLAAPPPGAAVPPAAPEPGASQREQLAVHTAAPECATCHTLVDPIGFALEPFDAMGVHRTHDEVGNPIDARGEITGSDIAAAIDGPVALAHALADSEQVERCYATQWFRLAMGRLETQDDRTELDALWAAFRDSGGHIPTLLQQLVSSEAFVYRRHR